MGSRGGHCGTRYWIAVPTVPGDEELVTLVLPGEPAAPLGLTEPFATPARGSAPLCLRDPVSAL